MEKRTVFLGDYDTASNGWTLTSLSFPEPSMEENLVPVPGRPAGPLDLSAILTEGEPCYGSRTLTITLETSEGTRSDREFIISGMINRLHGRKVNIVLPDRPGYYAVGRLAVRLLYSDLAHASVEITGTCEPWLYAAEKMVLNLKATATEKTAIIHNWGAMAVVPELEATVDDGGSFLLKYGTSSMALSSGTYMWPALRLTPGRDHQLKYSGSGSLRITYREGVLR